MYVIFGATGHSGNVAARALLAAGKSVRVVGRDRQKLEPLVAAGAQASVADVTQPSAARAALAGATAAYVLIPPNMAVEDFRGYQDQVAESLTSAVEAEGVRHVALLSSLGADKSAGTGPVVGLHLFERRLAAVSGLSTLSLRAGYFYENFFANIGMIKGMGANGSPLPPDVALGVIAAEDIGRYAARRLLELDFTGFSAVNLVGPHPLTMAEATRILGTAIGQPELPYVQVSFEALEQALVGMGMRPQLAALYTELHRGAAAGALSPEPGTPTATTETPFEAFAPAFAGAFAAS